MSMSAAGTPAIRMTGVVKTFGAVVANRDASLEVAAGEIHALVGENGAGKSTLMRLLAGMYAPDAGTVVVNGNDVTGWKTPDAIAAARADPALRSGSGPETKRARSARAQGAGRAHRRRARCSRCR